MGTTNETLGDFVLVRPIHPRALTEPVRGYVPVAIRPPLSSMVVEGPPDPDFLCGNYGSSGVWNLTTAGAGAAGIAASNGVDTTERAIGVLALATGTTAAAQPAPANGFASIRLSASGVLLGICEAQVIVRAAVSALSTEAEEYVCQFGFNDSAAAGTLAPTDGCYFFYDRAANGDFWCCRTVSNTATQVTTVTTVPVVAGVFSVFEIHVTADGGRVRFFIDGVQVATMTGGAIPTGAGRQTGMSALIAKTVQTAAQSRSIYLDSFFYRFSYGAER